jgi:hypothetical protein
MAGKVAPTKSTPYERPPRPGSQPPPANVVDHTQKIQHVPPPQKKGK